MDTLLGDGQRFNLTVMQTNPHGDPIRFVQVPHWSSSDPTVATVLPAPDGLSADVFAVASGTTDIKAVADGLTGTWNVVVSGPAIIFIASATMPK